MGWLSGSIVAAALLLLCIEPDVCHASIREQFLGIGRYNNRKVLGSSDVEQRVPVARDYPNAAKEQARSYSDYDHLRITWGDPSHYEIGEIIGHGTYANAYIGHVKGKRSQRVVIKHLKHASWYKIKREIAVMQALRDGPFTVRLLEVIPHLHEHHHHRMLTDDSSSSSSSSSDSSNDESSCSSESSESRKHKRRRRSSRSKKRAAKRSDSRKRKHRSKDKGKGSKRHKAGKNDKKRRELELERKPRKSIEQLRAERLSREVVERDKARLTLMGVLDGGITQPLKEGYNSGYGFAAQIKKHRR